MTFLVFFGCLCPLSDVKISLLLPQGVRAFDHRAPIWGAWGICGRGVWASLAEYKYRDGKV